MKYLNDLPIEYFASTTGYSFTKVEMIELLNAYFGRDIVEDIVEMSDNEFIVCTKEE